MKDYYDEILNYYEYLIVRKKVDPIWINRKIIEISKNYLTLVSKKKYINCLLLIQNLFMIDLPDHYHHKGKLIKLLNPHEYQIYTKIIKEEFSN